MIKYRVEAVLFLMVFLSLASGCNYGSQRESRDGSKKQEPSSASGSTAQTSGAPTAGDASLAGLQEEVVKLRAELRTVQERVAMLDGLTTGPKNVPGGRAIDTGAAATPESRASLATSTGSSPDSPILPAEYSPTSAYKDDPFVGPEDAPVIVMVFSDFQCPGCRRFDTDVIGRLRSDYAARGSVKLIFRDFPLERNQFARSAATLAHCAGEQGKYWNMYDLLYTRPEQVDSGKLDDLARMLRSVDKPALKRCRDSLRYEKELDRDLAEGRSLGAGGAPGTFIGRKVKSDFRGVFIRGAQPFEVIEHELASILKE